MNSYTEILTKFMISFGGEGGGVVRIYEIVRPWEGGMEVGYTS